MRTLFQRNNSHVLYLVLALFILVAAISFRLWFLMPIYPDEIGYRSYTGRAFFDNWHRLSGFPACETNGLLPIPWIFYPAAFCFSIFSFVQDMELHRLIGIGVFILNAWLAMWAGWRLLQTKESRYVTPLLLLGSALFVGVLASSFIMLRAEYIIFLTLFFAFWAVTKPSIPKLVVLLLLYSCATYMHPKTVFFLPTIIAAAFVMTKNRKWYMAAALLWLLSIASTGAAFHDRQLLHCPESPKFEAWIKDSSLNPADAFKNPGRFLVTFIDHLEHRKWHRIIRQMTFQKSYALNLLPPVPRTNSFAAFTNILVMASELVTLCSAFYFAWRHFNSVRRVLAAPSLPLGARIFSLFTQPHVLQLMLFLSYAALLPQYLLNTPQNFYDIGFWLTTLILLNVISYAFLAVSLVEKKAWHWFTSLLWLHVIAALFSVVVTYTTIFQDLRTGFAGPGLSVVTYNMQTVKQDISDALASCHLRADSPRLAFDDLTYPALQHSANPISITFASFTLGGSWESTIAWMRAHHASGIVTRCQAPFNTPVITNEHRAGQVCCISLQ